MPAPPPATNRGTVPRSDPIRPTGALAGLLGAAAAITVATLALLQRPGEPPPAPASGVARPCPLGGAGAFRGRFHGDLDFTADWSGSELACDGRARPDEGGFRLYFSGPGRGVGQGAGQGAGQVTVLVGLPGGDAGPATGEQPANVTVIDEQTARFFNSGGPGRCFADVAAVTPVLPAPGLPRGQRVDGIVYCVDALPSVGDRASLTLGDLRFSGWIGHGD